MGPLRAGASPASNPCPVCLDDLGGNGAQWPVGCDHHLHPQRLIAMLARAELPVCPVPAAGAGLRSSPRSCGVG
eukprot:8106408-Alexandrium_andersonii.AAC.1